MKDIIIPVSLPEGTQDAEWEEKAVEYAKQDLEKKLRAEFEKERNKRAPIWDEIKLGTGVFIDLDSVTRPVNISASPTNPHNKNIFLTEKHAKAALAIAQISQLMPYYGGEITQEEWDSTAITKYAIIKERKSIQSYQARACYEFIAFRTERDRERFMSREENMRLIKDYYMMD